MYTPKDIMNHKYHITYTNTLKHVFRLVTWRDDIIPGDISSTTSNTYNLFLDSGSSEVSLLSFGNMKSIALPNVDAW